jgi:hypothetical protein
MLIFSPLQNINDPITLPVITRTTMAVDKSFGLLVVIAVILEIDILITVNITSTPITIGTSEAWMYLILVDNGTISGHVVLHRYPLKNSAHLRRRPHNDASPS